MSAVREKKYLLSAEMSVIRSEDRLRTCRAQVTPEIPFPMITICAMLSGGADAYRLLLYEGLDCLFTRAFYLDDIGSGT